ncbi:MAG: MarR family winged helix-turn-helix transcriptional regulator [Solimonas sp.]
MTAGDRPDFAQLIPPEYRGHLGFVLTKAHRALVAELDGVIDDGLNVRHFALVAVLHHRGGLRQTDIGAMLDADRTTTMKAVDDLEERGMLRRTPHASDRRANAVELTDAGRAWRERMLPRLGEQENAFLEPLSAGERTLLHELLLKLVAAAYDRKSPNCHET